MSEYRGGLLGPLSKLFKRALKCESSSEANKLVYEWNEYIKYLNKLSDESNPMKGRWLLADGYRCSNCNYKLTTTGLPTHCPNCHREMEQ